MGLLAYQKEKKIDENTNKKIIYGCSFFYLKIIRKEKKNITQMRAGN